MAGAVLDDVPRVDGARTAFVAQQVAEPGEVLDAVAVGVDDGMAEPGPDLGRGGSATRRSRYSAGRELAAAAGRPPRRRQPEALDVAAGLHLLVDALVAGARMRHAPSCLT